MMEIGSKYSSFRAVEKAIEEYCHANSLRLWKRDSRRIAASRITKKIKSDLIYYEVKYSCIHGGRTYCKRGKGKRDKSTLKLDNPCMFFLQFRVDSKGENLELKAVNLNHNHEIIKSNFLNYPGEKKIPLEIDNEIKDSNSVTYHSDSEEAIEQNEENSALNEMLPITMNEHLSEPISNISLFSESNEHTSPVTESIANGAKRKYEYDERIDEAYNIMKSLLDQNTNRDEHDIYGEYVASRIKNSCQSQRAIAIAKYQIDTVLFNLEMGGFSEATTATTTSQPFTPMRNFNKMNLEN